MTTRKLEGSSREALLAVLTLEPGVVRISPNVIHAMRCNVQNIRENKVFSSYFFIYAGIPHIKHITSHTCILAALVQLLLVREGIGLCIAPNE